MSELPSTAPEPIAAPRLRRARTLRRIGLTFIALVVLAGAVGLLGIRTRTVTATGGGYRMSLEYPWTDRSDQPVHWMLTLDHAGGFSGPVEVAITQSYLDLLDINAIEPEPTGSRSEGKFV